MGGSGSGGGSGTMDWPSYMKDTHYSWLSHYGSDVVKYSITALMSAAQGNSPYASFVALNPAAYFGTMQGTVFATLDVFKHLNLLQLWNETASSLMTGNYISSAVRVHSDLLEEEMRTNTLPSFKAGMRNINAVMSTAYVIGDGIIRSSVIKNTSRFASELQTKMLDIAQRVWEVRLNWYKDCVLQSAEITRLYMSANLDAQKYNSETMAKHRLWDLRTYEYGVGVMAAISGGVAANTPSETSAVANAMGGALSGAAAGAQIGSYMSNCSGAGGAWGAGIGALVGIGMSFANR